MQSNIIKNLLNLKEVLVQKVKNNENSISFEVELPVKEHFCPCCNHKTKKIKNYRIQHIKDIPLQLKPTTLILKKRRYHSPHCGKSFFEDNPILNKYARTTKRLTLYIANELHNALTIKHISKTTQVAPSFVSRMLPYLAVTNTKLPRVLCIDEFKGNSGKHKYQVSLVDGETHKIIDILECRKKHALCEYFKKFPKNQLNNVKYVVIDLWETYNDIAFTYFKKAKVIADKFHYIRYVCNAVNECRIEVQKKLPRKERIYFKHSRALLLHRFCNLKRDEQKDELSYILINYSENLRIAYREKEALLDIIHSSESPEIKQQQFCTWIKDNLESPVKALQDCAKTYLNWCQQIKNSFLVPFTNGPTEGLNTKIKTLKRMCYGMPNFNNFRARILLLD